MTRSRLSADPVSGAAMVTHGSDVSVVATAPQVTPAVWSGPSSAGGASELASVMTSRRDRRERPRGRRAEKPPPPQARSPPRKRRPADPAAPGPPAPAAAPDHRPPL